jgi:hypothetical protein
MEKKKIITIRFNKNQKNKARRRSSRELERDLPLHSVPYINRKKYTRKKKHKKGEE